MHILGLDAHSATFSLAILNGKGKVCREVKRDTSAENLIEVVRAAPGPALSNTMWSAPTMRLP